MPFNCAPFCGTQLLYTVRNQYLKKFHVFYKKKIIQSSGLFHHGMSFLDDKHLRLDNDVLCVVHSIFFLFFLTSAMPLSLISTQIDELSEKINYEFQIVFYF